MNRRFPEIIPVEPYVPPWQQFRAEGQSAWVGLVHASSYIRKTLFKKRSTTDIERKYFDHQRELLRFLMEKPSPESRGKLALLGDVMWIRDSWSTFLDSRVLDFLNHHEAVVGNLETLISPRFKVKSFLPDYMLLNSPPELVKSFRRPDGRSTFTALSVANNHTLDFGDPALLDTLDFLDSQKIPHSGVRRNSDKKRYTAFEVDGIRCGFYAATWGVNDAQKQEKTALDINLLLGMVPEIKGPIDISEIAEVLREMQEEGIEFRIVSLHWGYEFEYYPDPRLMRVGHEIVRAGADLIVGAHPHVQQPCEIGFVNQYQERYAKQLPAMSAEQGFSIESEGPPRKAMIAYSLGNFATTLWTFSCRIGWILSLRLFRDPKTGRVDWNPAASTLVVNDPRLPPTNERKLLLLQDYLRLRYEHGGLPRPQQEYIEFLTEHLLGGSPSE